MSPNKPSFISEHTVEFYLVPRFQNVLSAQYSRSLPFFFSGTREGNSNSRKSDSPGSVRLCALFPRRPKLNNEGHVVMKVNEEVLSMAAELNQAGTPSFLGIPIVHSLFELAQQFNCLWFSPGMTPQSQSDFEVECEAAIALPRTVALRGPCSGAEVCQLIEAGSRTRSWQEAIETIRNVQSRANPRRGYRFPFGPAYKPVYFLLQ
jgi:hypothetical protein